MAIRNVELYIIEPKSATNYVENPSVENATTGYTAVGASSSIARSATYQRRGTYSLAVTPTTNAESGVHYSAISFAAGTSYTFSADVKDVNGQGFNLFIASSTAGSSDAVSSVTEWTGDGYWKRKTVAYTNSSTAAASLYVFLTRDSVASTTVFYTDGWQVEQGSESTYFDGDYVGFNRLRQDYGWSGLAHASASWRTAKTRSGGTLLRVRDYANIQGVVGLGMPPMVNNSIPSSAGGAYFQNTVMQPREVSVLLNFSDKDGLSGLYADRAQIVDAIKPDNVPGDEPIVLRWELEDTSGNVQSDPLDLVCTYAGGLEYNATDPKSLQILERATVNFIAHDPLFHADGTGGADLTVSSSLADAAYLVYRTSGGTWTSAGVVNGAVYDIVQTPDGKIYVCGTFTSIGGVSANRIAYWDGNAWNAMGTGLAGATLSGRCLVVTPDGLVIVGGGFATANGVTVNGIAKWTGSTFSAYGATPGVAGGNARVNCAALNDDGNLYIGGDFTSAGGTTVDQIAYWNGSAWAAVGTGTTFTEIISMAYQSRNRLFVGDQPAGSAGSVYRYDASGWTDLSAAMDAYKLAIARDGALYAAGDNGTGGTGYKFSVYRGGSWDVVFEGTSSTEQLNALYVGRKNVYLGGAVYTMDKYGYYSYEAYQYFNGVLIPLDVLIPWDSGGSIYPAAFHETQDEALWVGGTWTSTPLTTTGVNAITYGSSKAYPQVVFTGPGTLHQLRNYTTGKTMFFNALALQDGERAVLDLRPGRIRFTSNWRGNLLKYIVPGSDFDWFLMSGSNSISLLISSSTASTKAYMTYTNNYWSIDAAVR